MAMPFVSATGLSRRQVDLAGDVLRDFLESGVLWGPAEQQAAVIAWAFRAESQKPLTHVVMGLRSMVKTESRGRPVVVGQRLKRMPRIVEKLTRDHRSNLSRMQDIGGCRAILEDLATVDAVRRRIHRNKWDVIAEDDYIANPQPTGYRGVHIVVRKFDRPIEIQLRTPWQNMWANNVESIDLRRRWGLKDGRGPKPLLVVLERSAYAMDRVYRGEALSPEFDAEFADLMRAAREYL